MVGMSRSLPWSDGNSDKPRCGLDRHHDGNAKGIESLSDHGLRPSGQPSTRRRLEVEPNVDGRLGRPGVVLAELSGKILVSKLGARLVDAGKLKLALAFFPRCRFGPGGRDRDQCQHGEEGRRSHSEEKLQVCEQAAEGESKLPCNGLPRDCLGDPRDCSCTPRAPSAEILAPPWLAGGLGENERWR